MSEDWTPEWRQVAATGNHTFRADGVSATVMPAKTGRGFRFVVNDKNDKAHWSKTALASAEDAMNAAVRLARTFLVE